MNRYIRHGIATLNEIIPEVHKHWDYPSFRSLIQDQFQVGVTSNRMKTFGRAALTGKIVCAGCGLEATHFGIETFHNAKDDDFPHVNLYGIKDGQEVLFTHDHILARSLGGKDILENTQVMCSPCNCEKSKGEQILARERRAKKC